MTLQELVVKGVLINSHVMNKYKTELKYKSIKKPFLTLDNFLFYEQNKCY